MTFQTPFEKEMLAEARRTNELLEYLVMAVTPQRVQLGMDVTDNGDPTPPGMVTRDDVFGVLGLSLPPRSGQPPTPEQRAARFAARAAEVGLSPEKAEEVSARVAVDLDNLTKPVTADEVAANIKELSDQLLEEQHRLDVEAVAEQTKPAAKKAAAKTGRMATTPENPT